MTFKRFAWACFLSPFRSMTKHDRLGDRFAGVASGRSQRMMR